MGLLSLMLFCCSLGCFWINQKLTMESIAGPANLMAWCFLCSFIVSLLVGTLEVDRR